MDLTISRPYVEERGGGLYVAGTRVSLDSIIYAYRQGFSPESIVDHYPAVTLEQVYGAITFYLSHQAEVEDYLKEGDAIADRLRLKSQRENAFLHQKLQKVRDKGGRFV